MTTTATAQTLLNTYAATDTTYQHGKETWEQYQSRKWATQHPHEHAVVTAWYAGPYGQRVGTGLEGEELTTVLAGQNQEQIIADRSYALADGIPSAAELAAQLTEEDRASKYSGVYAVEMAAKGEAAAHRAIANYLAAADAPEGSQGRERYAAAAEKARREVKDATWQCEHRAKDAHGWGPESEAQPGRLALTALRIASAQAHELADAWDQATGKRYTCNDLEVRGQWREAAISIARRQDGALELERQAAAATRAYAQAVLDNRWDAALMTKRRREAGLVTVA